MFEHVARSNNISTLSFHFMRGLNDAIQTAFGSDKTNQEGQQAGFYRSFFQNYDMPGSTFVFSLACHMILGNVTPGQSALGGLDPAELALLGCNIADLGTHSIRKGAFTFGENATDAPPVSSMEIRGNHMQDGQKET